MSRSECRPLPFYALSALLIVLFAALGPWSLVSAPGHNGAAEETINSPPLIQPGINYVRSMPVLSPPRVEQHSITSPTLGRTLPFLVYLPPGYDSETDASYPVLYMLHGLGGSYADWRSLGLCSTADRLIGSGDIQPLIIVFPQGDQGYWLDHANGGPKWGSYIVRDLVNLVDGQYRTLANRQSRAIGGLSMGSHGALQLALNYPDVFSVVGAHSLVLRSYEQAFPFFGDRSYFRRNDPVSLVGERPASARRFEIWIDIGEGDSWRQAAEAFHEQLNAAKVGHSWNQYPGGHDATYWSAHTADYLRFYSDALNRAHARSLRPW